MPNYSYFPWVSDNHTMYIEVGRSLFAYKYFIVVYTLIPQRNLHFKLPFASKDEAERFFHRFLPKFIAQRADKLNENTGHYEYIQISLPEVIQIIGQTIQESNYSARKTKKLYEAMLVDF